MRNVGILGLGVLAYCMPPDMAAAQGITRVDVTGPYTQATTGMTYPVSIDDFRRVNVLRYRADGTDESAGYNRETPLTEIDATVYVFPSPSLVSIGSPQNVIDDARATLCKAQFRGIQHEITTAHPDAVFVSEGDANLTQGDRVHDGHKAFYTLTNSQFFGRVNVASRSDAYVFCFVGGTWTVEYRFDYPVAFDASEEIANFMRDLIWTIPPEKQ